MFEVKEKVYIVGAISGVKNWKVKFMQAISGIQREGYYCITTPVDYPDGLTQKEYMVLSCESVFWADMILVTKGWEDSKGTKAEIALAESIGLEIKYL